MRRLKTRIFAVLAALLMLLPGGALARSQYYCRMMGSVVASCCCTASVVTRSPRAVAELRLEDCCQRLSAANRSAAFGTRDAAPTVVRVFLPSALRDLFPVAAEIQAGRACSIATQAPLAIGPPLFVVHCAFLS
jgi:hypothetical protein